MYRMKIDLVNGKSKVVPYESKEDLSASLAHIFYWMFRKKVYILNGKRTLSQKRN